MVEKNAQGWWVRDTLAHTYWHTTQSFTYSLWGAMIINSSVLGYHSHKCRNDSGAVRCLAWSFQTCIDCCATMFMSERERERERERDRERESERQNIVDKESDTILGWTLISLFPLSPFVCLSFYTVYFYTSRCPLSFFTYISVCVLMQLSLSLWGLARAVRAQTGFHIELTTWNTVQSRQSRIRFEHLLFVHDMDM